MEIAVRTSIGRGPTKLAAFDSALLEAGVANYNLIKLSSVIPPGSKIKSFGKLPKVALGNWGDRLYVVMADNRIDTPNEEAWAGIGWVQDEKTGRGLFVEHISASEKTVRKDINASLEALCKNRRIKKGGVKMKLCGAVCEGEPICALTIAVYQADSWEKHN